MAFEYVIILCSVFLTSILSGVLGMAGGMILMGVLLWFLPVEQAMVLHATAQFFANGSRAYIHRQYIVYKTLPPYFLGMALVLIAAVAISFVPDKRLVFLMIGIMPFAAYALPRSWSFDFLKPKHGFGCGALVTAAHVTAGVSGPLLDVFFQSQSMNRHQNVATKAITQATSHIAKFIYFGFLVGAQQIAFQNITLVYCVMIVAAAVTGTILSRHILARISDQQFYRVTQIILFVIGGVYLFQALTYMPSQPLLKPAVQVYTEPVMIVGDPEEFAAVTKALLVSPLGFVTKIGLDDISPEVFVENKVRFVIFSAREKNHDAQGIKDISMALAKKGIVSIFITTQKVKLDPYTTAIVIDSEDQEKPCAVEKAILNAALEHKILREVFDPAQLAWYVEKDAACVE